MLLAAFRAPHPLGDILEPRVPAAESAERSRLSCSFVSAGRALGHEGILSELVTQLVDMEFARHAADFLRRQARRPSSARRAAALYGEADNGAVRSVADECLTSSTGGLSLNLAVAPSTLMTRPRYNSGIFSEGTMVTAKRKRRAPRVWTRDDVKNLRSYAKARLSGIQAALRLKRTPGAVAQKAMSLGIRFTSIRSRR